MANLDKLFKKFNETITISSSKKDSLRASRDALRNDIENWFVDHDKQKPIFHGQGSYAMKTLINPLFGEDYDIDDGIYIHGYENQDISKWPQPSTVHSWIKSAVEDRTKAGATDIFMQAKLIVSISIPLIILAHGIGSIITTMSIMRIHIGIDNKMKKSDLAKAAE